MSAWLEVLLGVCAYVGTGCAVVATADEDYLAGRTVLMWPFVLVMTAIEG